MMRWLSFVWIGALRFLGEGRLQTGFIVGGITIGVAVIVFMSAMLAGLEANFIKRVLTSQAQIQLLPPNQIARPLRNGSSEIEDAIVQRPSQRVISIDQWQAIAHRMEALPAVRAVAASMTGSALAIRGDASRSVSVVGIQPESYLKVVRLSDYIVAGQLRLTSDDILIGTDLARDLGASLGDKIIVSSNGGARRTLTVTALFDLGNKGANQRNTYVALRTAQSLLGVLGGVTEIGLTINNIYDAENIAREIESSNAVEADSWIKTNAQFFTAVQAQKYTNTLIRLFVGLSVAFGIAAVLVVSVIQRSKDIGILRAMGATRGQILRLFLLQGGLLGFAGSLGGSVLGAAALVYWHSMARQADGSELFPLIIEPSLFVATALLATLTGVAAAMAPALRASRLDPVEAIRG
ncbi:MAG: ABC transporter permease [Bosea sp.]|jgi:lipoprotein-releasing system permease protein|uniref:ABC transporter permease n=1 Tax=Bosea sp. (in: a-proteobacteria) TaxID=1871050 RepID=UPI001AD2B56F|nr:FtsX-like permease family protein [Bosea sp. (in: a-proteobacteria)]MBN9472206.1 ABC transporter permease [Bosea sp. (in: a-proteobacteria)]